MSSPGTHRHPAHQLRSVGKTQTDAAEQKQIADARKATQDYFDAAKKWVEIQKTTVTAEA